MTTAPQYRTALLDLGIERRTSFGLHGEEFFSETTRPNPHSPYSGPRRPRPTTSARAYHDTHGMPVIVTNCSNNYGPYRFPES